MIFLSFEGQAKRSVLQKALSPGPLEDLPIRAILRQNAVALDVWARYWYSWTAASFLRGYRRATEGANFLPSDDEEWTILLDVLVLQKAFYELDYELNNRPDWVTIPLQGIASLLTP